MLSIKDTLVKAKEMEKFDIEFSDEIVEEKGALIDKENKVFVIAVKNFQKEIVGYILADLEDYEKLVGLHYHCRYIEKVKSLGSTSLKKAIAAHILDLDDATSFIYANTNRMDLRRKNIRVVTKAQSVQMRSKKKEGKKYLGVSTSRKYFRANIKHIFIGEYKTEEQAAKAYDIYAIHLYGIDAATNKILTEEEKQDIVNNGIPEEYKKAPPRTLPKNIRKAPKGRSGYYYNFRYEGRSYQSTYDTIEDAVNGMAERKQLIVDEKLREAQLANVENDNNEEDISKGENDNIKDVEDVEDIDKGAEENLNVNKIEDVEDNLPDKKVKSLKEIRGQLPEEITIEFLKSIKHVQLFQNVVRKKNWGGKGKHFQLRQINQSNLKGNIAKAIVILNAENANMKIIPAEKPKKIKELEPFLAQLMINPITTVEEDIKILKGNRNQFIIDLTNNVVKIPLINSKNKTVGYSLISLNKYDLVKDYSFHMKVDRHGKKSAICGQVGKALEYLIFGYPVKGHCSAHKNSDDLDNRDGNVIFIERSEAAHYKSKRQDYYSSNYKGVTKDAESSFRATISYKGDYIAIGTFDDGIVAAIVYDIYSIHYYRAVLPTNGLLSQDEIDDVLENGIPKEFLKPVRQTLSPGIFKRGDYYYYEIRVGKITYSKRVSEDLDEAILARENKLPKIQRLWEEEKERLRDIMMKEMTMDERGYAIIYLHDREGNITGQTVVDKEIWFETNLYCWHLRDDGRVEGYVEGENVQMHQYLFEKYKGNAGNLTIDHQNVNPLDNFLENLRVANHSLQNHNRNKIKDSILKEKGVTINGNKFVVNPYKTRYSFEFLEDAVRKFNELAIERYGDKAKTIPVGEGKTKVIDIISVEDITPEYIDSIKHVELFKLVCKKKGWGGSHGKIKQSYIRANTLEDYKQIAKNLLLQERV